MRKTTANIVYSATDLVGYLECEHLSRLDRAVAAGLVDKPQIDDPVLERIAKRGELHERRFLDELAESGTRVTPIALDERLPYEERLRAGRDATVAAMQAGAQVIYQAVLYDGRRLGFADFLRRVEGPSELGAWGYEVWDTKLARTAKASAVLQLCFYSDLLGAVQGAEPVNMHLALGGFAREQVQFRVADYSAYYRLVVQSFEEFLEEGSDRPPDSTPDPVSHCDVCRWSMDCRRSWRQSDDLALVANLGSRHRLRMRDAGVSTRGDLAGLSNAELDAIEGIGQHPLLRARNQAEIQVRGERLGQVIADRIEPPTGRDGELLEDHGLLMLPKPSPGDLFVDFEGDPFFESEQSDGIEYLFGVLESGGAESAFHPFWSIEQGTVTTAGERRAFEEFIDLIMDRLEKDPDLHVYHFAPYEPAAIRRLAGRHNTREEEVDRLLRGRVFVDLYRAVRQGIRASVESYSIKHLEPLYGFKREVDLREAGQSIVEFETWLELDNEDSSGQRDELRRAIQEYNRDDCLSTRQLRGFLEDQRSRLQEDLGLELPRPEPPRPEETGDSEQQQQVNRLVEKLLAVLPAEISQMDSDQHATWLLAQLLNWHRREDKSFWWEYFRLKDELDESERVMDPSTLGALSPAGSWPDPRPRSRSTIYAFNFPPQEHSVQPDSNPHDPLTGKSVGTVVEVDDRGGQIQIRRGNTRPAPHPTSLIPFDYVNPGPKPERLRRLAGWALEHGIGAPSPDNRAGRDLLRRAPPRLGLEPGRALLAPGQDPAQAARSLALGLDESYLAIQGPPGSGKSTTGAEIIVDLVESGRRVGVTANSHKVFSELMSKVAAAARKRGRTLRMGQRSDDQVIPEADQLKTGEAVEALHGGAYEVVGGTTWLWAREDVAGTVDVLVIDEAGQMSLADALAASDCASSLVLLGDPQQLNQPLKGVHPPGAERSAMGHILDGDRVIAPELGIFLDGTWRLHPQVCKFTSEVFYEDQLSSRPGRERWLIEGTAPLTGTGLRLIPVIHDGNSNSSAEEARALARIVGRLLAEGPTCRDPDGVRRPISTEDVLVITPYNAQVARISEELPGFRVGTVDKFQGQEAPISVYSMATSSPAEAPRGMEFLYSLNRLNVATSRAQCLAVVIANPELVRVRCHTPRQMRLANALARFFELADISPVRKDAGHPAQTLD